MQYFNSLKYILYKNHNTYILYNNLSKIYLNTNHNSSFGFNYQQLSFFHINSYYLKTSDDIPSKVLTETDKIMKNIVSHDDSYDPNKYPKIGDEDKSIEQWKINKNIKIDSNDNMEMKDYLDPLYKKLPSYRTDLPMSLQGKMRFERERLAGMTDAERKWRNQWLKDQEIKATEPVDIPELYTFYNNFFRRAFHWPMDTLFSLLVPIIGEKTAYWGRNIIPRIILYYVLCILTAYHLCFNERTWERGFSGKTVWTSQIPVYQVSDRTGALQYKMDYRHYADCNFHNRTIMKDEDIKLER